MHTVRAEGQTARTELDPTIVALAVGLYLIGFGTPKVSRMVEISRSTLKNLLRRLNLLRTKAEAGMCRNAQNDRVHRAARRHVIQREYTRQETHKNKREIANRFGVSRSTINRDLEAIGWKYTPRKGRMVKNWGSVKAYYRAQRRAAVLTRKRGWSQAEAAEDLEVCQSTVHNMLKRYDERKS